MRRKIKRYLWLLFFIPIFGLFIFALWAIKLMPGISRMEHDLRHYDFPKFTKGDM